MAKTVTTPSLNIDLAGNDANRTVQKIAKDRVAWIASPTITGQTVYKLDGVWHTEQTPDVQDLNAADHVLLGGHETTISDALYDEIIAAGIALVIV